MIRAAVRSSVAKRVKGLAAVRRASTNFDGRSYRRAATIVRAHSLDE
jgi:hypothetical protein